MSKRLCSRCHDRLALKYSTYCRACGAEYQREVRRGEHKSARVCERCGDPFSGRGTSVLCRSCRTLPDTEKTCSKCSTKFYSHKDTHMRCGPCRRAQSQYMRDLYRDKYRERRIEKAFGLDPGQFAQMMEDQDGKCPICAVEFADLSTVKDMRSARASVPYTDHDHSCCDFNPSPSRPLCGKCLRQLVCRRCNFLLGNADDSVEILTSAVSYLQRWQRR